jgi:hypothetical protein
MAGFEIESAKDMQTILLIKIVSLRSGCVYPQPQDCKTLNVKCKSKCGVGQCSIHFYPDPDNYEDRDGVKFYGFSVYDLW